MPRRAPDPDTRLRDAERTRRKLLDAAFDEFAARGYAGARVQDIATRAGVNKQLITYYFGGKAGLYRELQQQWLRREKSFADGGISLVELAERYVRHGFADPRGTRLMLWRGLTAELPEEFDGDPQAEADLASLRRCQEAGELPADLDVRAFRLILIGMIVAPVAMPELVRGGYGLEPTDPEFTREYAEQIRRLLSHLGGGGGTDEPETEETP